MRPHLIKMFEINIIDHFPQDLNLSIPHKVLPLSEVNAKEVKVSCKRTIRQRKKMEQLNSNLLQTNCDFQQSEYRLNSNMSRPG